LSVSETPYHDDDIWEENDVNIWGEEKEKESDSDIFVMFSERT